VPHVLVSVLQLARVGLCVALPLVAATCLTNVCVVSNVFELQLSRSGCLLTSAFSAPLPLCSSSRCLCMAFLVSACLAVAMFLPFFNLCPCLSASLYLCLPVSLLLCIPTYLHLCPSVSLYLSPFVVPPLEAHMFWGSGETRFNLDIPEPSPSCW